MIIPLARSYFNRYTVPIIARVDSEIFVRTHHGDCYNSNCIDDCCAYGVCVDSDNVARIEAYAPQLASFLGIPPKEWFSGEWIEDTEFPGGAYKRTTVVNGACVFLNRKGRGCLLHAFCLRAGIDYHLLKPMLSSLFPATVEDELLRPSIEVADGSLICLGQGTSLYRGARASLGYFYGDALLSELDALERGSSP